MCLNRSVDAPQVPSVWRAVIFVSGAAPESHCLCRRSPGGRQDHPHICRRGDRHGHHVVKVASTLQKVVAVTPGEAELYAHVLGRCEGLLVATLCDEWGLWRHVESSCDSSVAVASCVLARTMPRPNVVGVVRCKGVLRYLRSHLSGVLFLGFQQAPRGVLLYTDSGWAGDKMTRKSARLVIAMVAIHVVSSASPPQKVELRRPS